MRTTLILLVACGLMGFIWACGGATEQPVAEPEPPDVDAPDVEEPEAPAEEPTGDEKPAEEPSGDEKPAEEPSGDEKPAEEPTGDPKPADEKPADEAAASGFEGKGVHTAVLGNDKGAKGVTNFDHWKHQEDGVKCYRCHHKGAGRKSCNAGSDCHKFKEVNAPRAKDAYHKACNPCHRKKGLPKGCDYCHQPKAS